MPTDLSSLVKAVFKDKRQYQDFEDEDKEKLFFIFNRYVARNYPENANFFNKKGIDKAMALDIWFDFFRDSLYIPGWFYPAKQIKKERDPNDTILDGIDELDEYDKEVLKQHFSHLVKLVADKQKVIAEEDFKSYKVKGKKKGAS